MEPPYGTDEARRPQIRHAIGFYLAWIALSLLGGLLLVSLLRPLGVAPDTDSQTGFALGVLVQALLTVGILGLFLGGGRFHAEETLRLRPSRRFGVYLVAPVVIVALGILVAQLGFHLVQWVPALESETLIEFVRLSRFTDPGSFVLFALVMGLAPGITEELAFRGFILTGLRSYLGPGAAVTVTALLFALVHVEPLYVILTFPPGLFLGYLVVRTRSVYPAVAAHAFNNLWSTLEAALWQAARPGITEAQILFGLRYSPVVIALCAVVLVGGIVSLQRMTRAGAQAP